MIKEKVQIVSWLLTRKCNLKCSYCSISSNYKTKPSRYPDINYYLKNEMTLEFILNSLERLQLNNPHMFHIFYGGEPLLRKDLSEIIKFCNDNSINYTIITNNSDLVQTELDNLFSKTKYITGLTSSIDPILFDPKIEKNNDRYKKSEIGFERLKNLKDRVKDPVAEITVDNQSIHFLYDLVEKLTDEDINSDITFIDIAKNKYYDFSNITDPNVLVNQNNEIWNILIKIINNKLNVHMSDVLLPKIYKHLPANMDCKIEKYVHNLTIDADGSVRLCLRIRGTQTPKLKLLDYIDKEGNINEILKIHFASDKMNYCLFCNWTCMEMSKILSSNESLSKDLIHSKKRGE